MSSVPPQTAEYRCPGQGQPISRAVHLGRMAQFYPGCRQCPHRDDTGTLSAKQVEQLAETRFRGLPRVLLHEEWAGGVYLNELAPSDARELAVALGRYLAASTGDTTQPVVLMAGDGRPISSALVAAVADGLRFSGCNVVDIGPATSPCLAFAIDYHEAAGGILVGNPADGPHTTGLKFWADGARPLSAGGALDTLGQLCQATSDRPTRSYGSLERLQADGPYLADLADYYHALRPLRLVLHTSSRPLLRYLDKLTEPVACQVIPCRTLPDELPTQVLADRAHFGIRIHDDGETCRVFDEQGRSVPAQRVLLLIAGHLCGQEPQATIVLEQQAPPPIVEKIEAAGARVISSDPSRAAMAAAMCRHEALLGGGPSGRLWYNRGRLGLPDALMTLSLLLVILSQSDRPLAEVLDRSAPCQ